MKKFLSTILVLGLSLSLSPLAIGDVPEENFYPSVKQEAGWMGYNSDNSIAYSQPSSLYAVGGASGPDYIEKMSLCDSLEAKECSFPELNGFTFTSTDTVTLKLKKPGDSQLYTFKRRVSVPRRGNYDVCVEKVNGWITLDTVY